MSSPSERPPRLSQQLLAAGQHDGSWLVRVHGQAQRSLTLVEVVDAYNERLIDPETYVWTDGMRTWQQLQAVDAIVDALHREAARDASSTWPLEAPKPSATAHAAGFWRQREGSVDAPDDPARPREGTARDESAMFSLASLVSGAAPLGPDETRSDDSGIIDLAALTRAAPLSSPSPPLLASNLFGAAHEPMPVAPPMSASPGREKKDRRVVAVLVALVAILSVALVVKLVASDPTTASAVAATPAGAEATTSPKPDHEASAHAVPSALLSPPAVSEEIAAPPTAAASSGGVADSAPHPPAQPAVRGSQPPWVRAQPPGTTTPPKTPPPATGGCPCKPDDLQCHMRCAAR